MVNFPSWFLSLYQTCLSLLNAYCNSSLPILSYDNFPKPCCSICEQFFIFLQNSKQMQQTFLIPNDKIYHFNTIVNQFNPLILLTMSMTSDKQNHQINIIKMSIYDDEVYRENNLLRSLLSNIQLSNYVEDQSHMTRSKRFKSSI
jgi:hypothetical protein